MSQLILFNKPFGVLSQFTAEASHPTLAEYIDMPKFYAAGRLDRDSEGLMLLTNDGKLQQKISDPKFGKKKIYWAQVEDSVDKQALQKLQAGLQLKDGMTKKAEAIEIAEPDIWERNPPIRERKNIPTSWIELTISEGKNRQVRRMTAAVGFPTLRLIRVSIDRWKLNDLQPGEWKLLEV